MSSYIFTSTRLALSNKKGILKPTQDGYYTVPIGGLNCFNSANEYYTLNGAEDLFKNSGILMRRISNGCLKGEMGHPKKQPAMTDEMYLDRVLSIEETNICCHYRKIWLDKDFGKNNPQFNNKDLVAIMAEVAPCGPKGEALKASFENKDENVCFSIRALTQNYYHKGQTYRVLSTICTWDNVNEPGIANATKWSSPSLEELGNYHVTKQTLEHMVSKDHSIAKEDSKILIQEALKPAIVHLPTIALPLYAKW